MPTRPLSPWWWDCSACPPGPSSQHGAGFYPVLTWVFSFIGMIVLGMWLGAAQLHRADPDAMDRLSYAPGS